MQIYGNKRFDNPVQIIESFSSEDFLTALDAVERYARTHYLLGYVRYAARAVFAGQPIHSSLPLLYFEVYAGYDSYHPAPPSPVRSTIIPGLDFKTYHRAITAIKAEIAAGNSYQINYTYDNRVKTSSAPLELYESLLPGQTTPYNAFLQNRYETVLSFSPELFFEWEQGHLRTKPMKGTSRRGGNPQDDAERIAFLRNDSKNRAENVMIVDLLRNDLGKIAETGTVTVESLFAVETHPTVHQMTSEIRAQLRPGVGLAAIFAALFPCGSVTGAPKIRSMAIIDAVEVGDRGIYCGAIGFLTPQKATFSVPIRILHHREGDRDYTYRVGGAIVWDSTPEEEWEESLTKMQFLHPQYQLVETILVENNRLTFAEEHIHRLETSAQALGFACDPASIMQKAPHDNGMLRILLSWDGRVEFQTLCLKTAATFRVRIAADTINSQEPLLYHKTTHRPWYDPSMERIKAGEVYDELFFNERGELTEGARSNIVLACDGVFYTPPLSCGLLNGVARQDMINRGLCREKVLFRDDLNRAGAIYCLNSVRGLVEVSL